MYGVWWIDVETVVDTPRATTKHGRRHTTGFQPKRQLASTYHRLPAKPTLSRQLKALAERHSDKACQERWEEYQTQEGHRWFWNLATTDWFYRDDPNSLWEVYEDAFGDRVIFSRPLTPPDQFSSLTSHRVAGLTSDRVAGLTQEPS